MTKITKEKFKEALKGTGGIMIKIADRLQVSRQAVYDFCKRYADMEKARQSEEEKILDIGENSLFAKAKAGEPWAVKMLLSTKGKKRGYVEKKELQVDAQVTDTLSKTQIDKEVKRLIK